MESDDPDSLTACFEQPGKPSSHLRVELTGLPPGVQRSASHIHPIGVRARKQRWDILDAPWIPQQ